MGKALFLVVARGGGGGVRVGRQQTKDFIISSSTSV